MAWLQQTTFDITLLILFVLLVRPVALRAFGAHATYALWSLPLARALMPERLADSGSVLAPLHLSLPRPGVAAALLPLDGQQLAWSIPWLGIWLAGIALWIGARGLARWRFRRALQSGAAALELPPDLASSIAKRVPSIPGKARFFRCADPRAPFVTGLLRPAVFLPQDFSTRFAEHEQPWVLVHELTHVRRGDLWVQLWAEAFRAVFWFHPLVHVAARVLRHDQELACDHSVLRSCDGEERHQYGRALLAETRFQPAASTLGFLPSRKERFVMLSRHRASSFRTAVGVVLGLVLGTLALIQMPALARTSVMPDEPVTILLEAASVREAIARMADFAAVEVVNLDRVDPTLLVSSRATRVPASTVFESLLFCSGHRYVEIEAGIELVTTMTFGGSYSCRISEAGQVEVSADSITAYDEGSADRL